MLEKTGAGVESAGPFFMCEPLGLLTGVDAAAAVAAGIALPLAGGPSAFSLVRIDGLVVGAVEAAAVWPGRVRALAVAAPDWAGLGPGPLIMGIVNVTPDSFSDGGDRFDPDVAIAAGLRMLDEGAAILDVGGESTRPGAAALAVDEEQARVLPVVAALARAGAVVSIDTRNAATMAAALDAGARIVNDVTALAHDPAAAALVARRGCPVVLMHMRGTPSTMRGLAVYDDIANEVVAELAARVSAAEAAGVRREAIMVDPGFGFAKTAEQNVELLRRMAALTGLGCAVMAGISRKAVIGMLSGEAVAKRRAPGSVAAALYALDRGARVLRVHDVAETRQAVSVWVGLAG